MMGYLTQDALEAMGFAQLGKNVKISEKASIYEPEKMEIGDYSRIDDFCVVSGRVVMGRNVYVGPFTLIAGGLPGITFQDFTTLAYHVQVFSQSDDYRAPRFLTDFATMKQVHQPVVGIGMG